MAFAEGDPELQPASPPPSKAKTAGQALKANCIAYCDSTSVHGFAYLPDPRHMSERVFWGCVIITGLTLASIIINQAYASVRKSL